MKQLLPLATPPSYVDLFEAIRDNKRLAARLVLVGAEASIRNRFAEYESRFAANTLQGMPATTLAGIRAELRSCYGRNKGMKAILQAIRSAQPLGRLLWCPYCGATTPGSHDHYLPAQEFPEFSAHALNLIPACTRCNSIKESGWLDAGARKYLHFYLDAIPTVPFLTVTIASNAAIQAVGATFSIQQAGMSAASWSLIEAHFRNLKLIQLYDFYSNDLISTSLKSARSFLNAGGANVQEFLANEAAENATLYGSYSWRPVLMRALSIHPDLGMWMAWL